MIASSTNAGVIRKLADRLILCPIGEPVTKEDLAAAAGADFEEVRHLVQRARKLASADTGAVFKCLYRVGYLRLSGEEGPAVSRTYRVKVKRVGKSHNFFVGNILRNSNDISQDAIKGMARGMNTMGIITALASDRWSQPDEAVGRPPPTAEAISAMVLKTFKEIP